MALFLAGLSHRWFWWVAAALILLAVTARFTGRRLEKARAGGERRPDLRVLRIALLCLLLGGLPVLAAAFSHLGCAALVAHQTRCLSNVKRLGMGMLMYAEDFDQKLPAASGWSERIAPRVPPDSLETPFRCPAAEFAGSYGMNRELSGVSVERIAQPAVTVLLFEADAPYRSFAGGPAEVARRRHGGVPNFGFADGHAKRATPLMQRGFRWNPRDSDGSSHPERTLRR